MMNRRDLLKLTLAGAFGSVAAAKHRQLLSAFRSGTSLPATYIIDYGRNHLSDPKFISRLAEAPVAADFSPGLEAECTASGVVCQICGRRGRWVNPFPEVKHDFR